jgi:UDP-GlcNAc:undecaprenyl-phosphate GlcNAc-1-phosphate transferase
MITNLSEIFRFILVAAVTSLLVTPLMTRIARIGGLVDEPGSAAHKTHSASTPLAGGLVIASCLALGLLMLPISRYPDTRGIFIGTAAIFVWGLVDDRFRLKPGQKLFGQVIAAILAILFGVGVHITRIVWLDLLISVVWLVGLTNAFNFVDSMDGLAVGLAGVTLAFFMLVTIDSSQPGLAALAALMLGTVIGLYFYVSSPAHIFLGDAGAQSLGMLLGALGIAYTPGQAGLPQALTWFIPILALSVPIFDMILVVTSRLRRRQAFYKAGTDHLYHRLVALGLHPIRAVAVMHIFSILAGLVAFIALGTNVVTANLLFAVCVAFGFLLLLWLERRYGRSQSKQQAPLA